MDLRIKITDEDDEIRGYVTIYQDGSDSEGADKIIDWIKGNFTTEGADVQYGP